MIAANMALSDDCRRVARNLAQRLDLGLRSLLAPFLLRYDRNVVDRLMIDHDTPEHKKRLWPSADIELLADITATRTPFKAADVLAYLADPQAQADPDLRALVRREEFHLHASATRKAMEARMNSFARRPRKVVSCEGPLRLDLGSAEVIDAQVNNETRFWGTNKRRALYRKTCAIDRQVDVLNDYEAADSVIIGQRSMYFDDLGACRGLYAGLDPAHAIESKSDFALEYVKELGVDYRCIDETKWPQDLRLWAENFERIMAFDDRVLMYVQEAGTHRIIFEKTGDPSRDTLFDQELKKLYEAVSPRFLRHPPTRQAVLEMFEMDGDAIEQATRQINEERACREESSDIAADYPDRAPHRVWIPRR